MKVFVRVLVVDEETGREVCECRDMTAEVILSGGLHLRSEFIGDDVQGMYSRCAALLKRKP